MSNLFNSPFTAADGTSVSALGFTNEQNGFTVVGNRARAASTTSDNVSTVAAAAQNGFVFGGDFIINDASLGTSNFGLDLTASSIGTNYFCIYEGAPARFHVYKKTSGFALIGDGGDFSFVAGQTARLDARVEGTALSFYKEGTLLCTVSDAGVAQIDHAGIYGYNIGDASSAKVEIDNFSVDTLPPALLEISPANSNVFWSPGVTRAASDGLHLYENGSYFKLNFTDSSLGLRLDTTFLRAHSLPFPQLFLQVGSGAVSTVNLADNGTNLLDVMLSTTLSSGQKQVQVWLNRVDDGQAPFELIVTKILLGASAVISAPALRPNRALLMGDSITHKFNASNCLTRYAHLLAVALDAEYGVVGRSGQGWLNTNRAWTGLFPPLTTTTTMPTREFSSKSELFHRESGAKRFG